jgi:hypothetical protein
VSQVAFLLQLGRAQICQFKEFVRSRHRRLILATWLPGNLATQLPSYPATQLPSYPATQLPSYPSDVLLTTAVHS